MNNILKNEDIIISENASVEVILNENYSNLFFNINSYFKSLLLDIRLDKTLGYCFYNDIISASDVLCIDSIELIMNSIESREDIEYLQMLILKREPYEDILEQFYQNTKEEYRVIERELKRYIDIIYSIIIEKIS